MEKTEAEGGGRLAATESSDPVAKLPTAVQSPEDLAHAEPEPGPDEDAPSRHEIPPPPIPTVPRARARGRGTKEEPRVRAKDGERMRQTSIHLPVRLHKRIRKYAFDREIALSTVMVDAIQEWLDAHEG